MLLTTPERFQENPRQFLDILHYEAVALTLSEEKSLVLSADLMTHWEHMEDHSAEIDVSVSFFAEEGGIYLDRLLNGSKVNVILEDGKALQLSGEVLDHDVGPANVRVYDKNGKVGLVSTNREINQIAFYEIESL